MVPRRARPLDSRRGDRRSRCSSLRKNNLRLRSGAYSRSRSAAVVDVVDRPQPAVDVPSSPHVRLWWRSGSQHLSSYRVIPRGLLYLGVRFRAEMEIFMFRFDDNFRANRFAFFATVKN